MSSHGGGGGDGIGGGGRITGGLGGGGGGGGGGGEGGEGGEDGGARKHFWQVTWQLLSYGSLLQLSTLSALVPVYCWHQSG